MEGNVALAESSQETSSVEKLFNNLGIRYSPLTAMLL
jgi:hypothetical protein